MQTKALSSFEVKDADQGTVEAIFSTFDVIDSDGDIIKAGAFTDGQEVLLSAYGHKSWMGELPVGDGKIRNRQKDAVFEGQFWLDTEGGAETFKVVKRAGAKQEWSYSLEELKWSMEEIDGRNVRVIESVGFVKEVSPVLRGAGVGTRTLGVKSGLRFAEHVESVLADVDALATRAAEVVALRAEKGKGLAEESAESLAKLVRSVERLKELLVAPAEPDAQADELAREYARFVALTTRSA